jgi:hypothetical protein
MPEPPSLVGATPRAPSRTEERCDGNADASSGFVVIQDSVSGISSIGRWHTTPPRRRFFRRALSCPIRRESSLPGTSMLCAPRSKSKLAVCFVGKALGGISNPLSTSLIRRCWALADRSLQRFAGDIDTS